MLRKNRRGNFRVQHKATKCNHPKGCKCASFFDLHALFILKYGLLLVDFSLAIQTLITNIYIESDKLRKCKILRYYIIWGWGHNLQMGDESNKVLIILLQPY